MILWVNPNGTLAYQTLDQALDDACAGDHIILFGHHAAGTFSGIPEGLDDLVIEAPEGAEIILDEPVLVESYTTFIRIDFYGLGDESTLCAARPGLINLDDCGVDGCDDDDMELL